MLVVDGLDEAEPGGDGLAFGLLSVLPDGVFVIATNRTGYAPGRPDTPTTTLRIVRADPRNRTDIRRYLAQAAVSNAIAVRLTEAKMKADDFIDLLASRRCRTSGRPARCPAQHARAAAPPTRASDTRQWPGNGRSRR